MKRLIIFLILIMIGLSLIACIPQTPIKGDMGETGLSAYEIYKKYNPNYTGDEEQWIDDLANGRLKNKEEPVYGIQYIRTDYCYNDYEQREIVIESREQLDEYNALMTEVCVNSFEDFIEATDIYDEEFFNDRLLVYIVLMEGSGGNRHEIKGIEYNQYNTIISMDYSTFGNSGDEAEWHIIVPLKRADINNTYFVASFPIGIPSIDNGLSRSEKITKLSSAFKNMRSFAGAWVHTDEIQYLNIGLAVSESEIERLNAMANFDGIVIYHRQDFLYAYLETIQNTLLQIMGDCTIYSIGTKMSKNQVDIYLNDENDIGLIISFLQKEGLYSMTAVSFNVYPDGGIQLS